MASFNARILSCLKKLHSFGFQVMRVINICEKTVGSWVLHTYDIYHTESSVSGTTSAYLR